MKQVLMIFGVIVFLIACVGGMVANFFLLPNTVHGVVTEKHWKREIVVEKQIAGTWKPERTISLEGTINPAWPNESDIKRGERLGQRSEFYTTTIVAEGETHVYTSDHRRWENIPIGSQVEVSFNRVGIIFSVKTMEVET